MEKVKDGLKDVQLRRRRRPSGEACDAVVCNMLTLGFLWAILVARSDGLLGYMGLEPRRAVYTCETKLDTIRFSKVFETTGVEGVQKQEGRAGEEGPAVFS